MFLGIFTHVKTYEFNAKFTCQYLADLCLTHTCRPHEEKWGDRLVWLHKSGFWHHNGTYHFLDSLILTIDIAAYALVEILQGIVILACKCVSVNTTNFNENLFYYILTNLLIACSFGLSVLIKERILLQISTSLIDYVNSLVGKETVAYAGITLLNGIFYSLLIILHTVMLLVDRE